MFQLFIRVHALFRSGDEQEWYIDHIVSVSVSVGLHHVVCPLEGTDMCINQLFDVQTQYLSS